MVKQSGNIFKEQIRRSFCLSQPGNFKEQGTSRVCEASAVSSSRKRLAGKTSAQEVKVGHFARIGFFDVFTEPLSFGIKQGFIASVGLFIDFTMANTGESSGTSESFSKPADAGEQAYMGQSLHTSSPSRSSSWGSSSSSSSTTASGEQGTAGSGEPSQTPLTDWWSSLLS